MKIKRFHYLTILFLYWVCVFCSAHETTAFDLPLRDPFTSTALIYCSVDQQNASHPLNEWRLLGAIGRQNRWQSWLINKNKQWLLLKNGDLLPDSELEASKITATFIEFNPRSVSTNHCDDLPPLKLELNS